MIDKTVLTDQQIDQLIAQHDVHVVCSGEGDYSSNGDNLHQFARAIERAVLAAATPGQEAVRNAADVIIAAARCIRHWHDSANDGMIVSGSHVRSLWQALEDYDSAIASAALKSASVSEQKGNV